MTAALLLVALSGPAVAAQAGIDEHLGARLPADLIFTDQSGHQVRLGELIQGGHPTILVLSYYQCPMLCGLVLRGLVDALRQMKETEPGLVTISFDPNDTPARAAKKRDSVLSDLRQPRSWPFLVGERATISALTDALGFRYGFDAQTKQFAHPSAIFILTPDGRIARYLYGVSYPPGELNVALREAANGRTSLSLAGLIMTCFRYDPNTRRYGPYLVGFFRAGSALLLLAVGLLLWHLHRRERAAQE